MGIYSDGKIYGIHIKNVLKKDSKITSQEPLTQEQIQDFLNSKIIDSEKSTVSVYFLQSTSNTYINVPNKTYIWVPGKLTDLQ